MSREPVQNQLMAGFSVWGAICVKIEKNFTVIKNLGFTK